jgi:hypothetical protein
MPATSKGEPGRDVRKNTYRTIATKIATELGSTSKDQNEQEVTRKAGKPSKSVTFWDQIGPAGMTENALGNRCSIRLSYGDIAS